jgi:hypothetical protein
MRIPEGCVGIIRGGCAMRNIVAHSSAGCAPTFRLRVGPACRGSLFKVGTYVFIFIYLVMNLFWDMYILEYLGCVNASDTRRSRSALIASRLRIRFATKTPADREDLPHVEIVQLNTRIDFAELKLEPNQCYI